MKMKKIVMYIIQPHIMIINLFQIEATFHFLLLSSERSFKMSETYYDYNALEQEWRIKI